MLLVEDDDGDALLVEDQLAEGLPFAQVERSRTLAEALASVERAVECVVLDLQLPDALGLDAVVQIRARAPRVALVVLTGLDDEAAGVAAVNAGAQDFLVKGKVDAGGLARAIRYSIGRQQSEDARRQLSLAEAAVNENARLERGLAPSPLVVDDSVWIAARYRAGRSRALLGGDFYDVVEASDGRLRALIGDVCGHGPDEAAVGVCLRTSWRALALSGRDAEAVLPTLELVLEYERQLPSLFTTLCTVELDPAAGSLHLIRAGHPSPIMISEGHVSSISQAKAGPAIGLPNGRWSPEHLPLPSDWTLLLYTDGITDGRAGVGPERLGEAGVERLVSEYVSEHPGWRDAPETMLDELILRAERLNGEMLTDDVAMLLVGCRPARDPRA